MFPFIDPVFVRLNNKGDRPVKIGYQVITPGTWADVPVGTLHAPALTVARDSGVEFVGMVVGGELYGLSPMEMPADAPAPEAEPPAEEVKPEPTPEEMREAHKKAAEEAGYVSSASFVETTTKEQVKTALEEVGLTEVVLDYNKMKKPELASMAANRGIDVTGMLKEQIIESLLEGDAGV